VPRQGCFATGGLEYERQRRPLHGPCASRNWAQPQVLLSAWFACRQVARPRGGQKSLCAPWLGPPCNEHEIDGATQKSERARNFLTGFASSMPPHFSIVKSSTRPQDSGDGCPELLERSMGQRVDDPEGLRMRGLESKEEGVSAFRRRTVKAFKRAHSPLKTVVR